MATMESSASPQPSTRHRVEEEFVNLLEEDFGIDAYSLTKAYMGVPPAPKTQAIALCEWAIAAARGDVEEAGKALRWWARKNLFLTRFLANSHLPLREEACPLEQRPSWLASSELVSFVVACASQPPGRQPGSSNASWHLLFLSNTQSPARFCPSPRSHRL